MKANPVARYLSSFFYGACYFDPVVVSQFPTKAPRTQRKLYYLLCGLSGFVGDISN